MKAQELRDIANRLLKLADEMEGIRTDGGTLRVTIPQPDLFSQMGLTDESPVDDFCDFVAGLNPPPTIPQKRVYNRVGCKMRDEAIVAASKVGRAQGYCQRSDIERSLRRNEPNRTREEIREAVNAAVAELGLTCIVFNSYRFYRKADRKRIIAIATAKLNNSPFEYESK